MATAQDYSLRKKVFAASWIVIFVAAGISAYSVFKAPFMGARGGGGTARFPLLIPYSSCLRPHLAFFPEGRLTRSAPGS